jgi:hypothetical protein
MRSCTVLALGLSLLVGRTAAAEPSLADAQRQVLALEYGKAIQIAQRVIVRGGSSPAQLRQLYELLGQALASVGREPEAMTAFRQLLALQPDYRLPEHTSPKIRAPLAKVQSDWAGRPGLTVSRSRPGPVAIDRDLVIVIKLIEDPLHMSRSARSVCALPGREAQSFAATARIGDVALLLPLSTLGVQRGPLHCQLELLDAHGNALWRQPLELQLVPAERLTVARANPWYKRWWVWTVAGVVIAGAATAAVVTATTRNTSSDIAVGWSVKSLRW